MYNTKSHNSQSLFSILCIPCCSVVNAQRLGDLRLGGFESTRLLGRLEFFFRTDWYPICNDEFGFEEAAVACRQLGLGYPVAIFNPDPVSASESDSLLGR